MLLGATAVFLVACRGLLTPLRSALNERTIKFLCLVTLLATTGLGVPYSFVRAAGVISPDAAAIPAIMACAAVCAVLWTVLLSASGSRPLPMNIWLFTGFFVLICVTTIFSRIPGHSFEVWSNLTWKVAAMTLASAWLARTQRDLLNASNIYIVSGLLIAVVVYYNKIHGISLVQETRVSIGLIVSDDPEAVRASQRVLSDPNDLALILMFPLGFTFARIVHRRNIIEGLVAALASGAILLGIIFTQSRGAAIGIMMVAAITLLQRYKSIALGLMAVLVAAPLMLSAMSIATRSSGGYEEFAEGDLDDSAQHRVDAWKTAINMAIARPLTGVGLANFSPMYYTYTDYWHNKAIAAHSMWFQVLGELGFVGLALFIAMIWSSFNLNARTIRLLAAARAPPTQRATAVGLQAALAGTCASGTFLSQGYNWPIYIIIALIAALANQVEEPAAQHTTVNASNDDSRQPEDVR